MIKNDVVVYLSSLKDQSPSRKTQCLLAFATGAQVAGARVHIETEYKWQPSRLAVMLGWASPEQRGQNIKFRAEIIQRQQEAGGHVMAIDANCFKFDDPDSRYLRYSINGVFYDSSEYANKNSNDVQWNTISHNLNLQVKPWKTSGDYVLLLLQRDGGWSMKGLNPLDWAANKIAKLKSLTNLPIVIRPHPGKVANVSKLIGGNVTLSNPAIRTLKQDLTRASAALVYNSSSGVAAVLEGVPLFVDDVSSVCWQVANRDINRLTNPNYPDRTQWIYDLAAAHWSDADGEQGLIYKKFLPYLA
jgi:hypothetical protein